MIKLLKKLEKLDWLIILACFILISLQVWLDLKLPDYMSSITVLVQRPGSSINDILINGLKMLSCAFGSLTSAIVVGYLTSQLSARFSFKIRQSVFKKVTDFGMEEVKKFQTSSLITRTTNDVTHLEMFLSIGSQMLIKAPIMAIWAVTKILNKNIEWSILTGGCVIALLATVATILLIVFPRFERVQKLIDKINGVTRENLNGIRVIHAFNAEKYQQDRFETVNNDLTKNQLFNQRCFAILSPIMLLVMHSLTLGIYIIGAFLITNANMSDKITIFSNMVVFTSYGMQVIAAFLMLAMIFMILPRSQVSAQRINEVLEEEEKIKDGDYDQPTKEKGTVEFKNVSFKYPDADEYILENISFKANAGETIAFIGSTGSGKSTLISLIPRFYDVTDGEILIDGINVKKYKQRILHNKIGYVPQKAVLFTGTVATNVAYGENDHEESNLQDIKEAINVAQGTDFVEQMDQKYDAHIARGGTNVSGGQKQRLSIARAIARKPEIYIFDDSFSALDYQTDLALRKALKKQAKNATVMIVAQRIGTIMQADKIVVLDKGKCVGIGTHQELLKKCKVYKEIALSQLTKEELANA